MISGAIAFLVIPDTMPCIVIRDPEHYIRRSVKITCVAALGPGSRRKGRLARDDNKGMRALYAPSRTG